MQLIINITEHEKSVIDRYVDGHGYSYKDLTRTTVIESLAQAVHKGTPLPKGHGKLKDVSNMLTVTEIRSDGSEHTFVPYSEIEDAPTIIEADRSEEE